MKRLVFVFLLAFLALSAPASFAVTVAPRITDREIVEKLAKLEAGQASIEKRFDDVNKRIDDLKESNQVQINDLKESNNKRFDTLQWMLGLFITIALSMMGAMWWTLIQQQQRLAKVEQSLETQKDEINFLKTLIEKLLPPRGIL